MKQESSEMVDFGENDLIVNEKTIKILKNNKFIKVLKTDKYKP